MLWQALSAWLPQAPVASMAERQGLAAAALLPPAAALLFTVLVQTAARLLSGKTEGALGRDGPYLLASQFAIADGIEQMVIFMPALLALAAGAAPAWTPRILALGGVFAAARLATWLGGLASPLARAPGRAASLAICATTTVAAAWAWS